MKKKCYIFGAGEYFGEKIEPEHEDYVIAADGGYSHLSRQNTKIDLIIGDFDSLELVPQHPNVITLPKEKDDTDMMAAIKAGLHKGYQIFHIYGATGGRLDHTLANIQCLTYLSGRGCRGYLFGKDYMITALTDDSIEFHESYSGVLSLFSHSDISVGVSIQGMKYELADYQLSNTRPLAVSNEFIGQAGRISVSKGTLIIMYPLNESLHKR